MKSLEDWISSLVEQDINDLDQRYSGANYYAAEKEIASLNEDGPTKYISCHVEATLLEKLYRKLRNQKCEDAIWNGIIFYLSEPLPTPMALDLIDREILLSQLAHTPQNHEVLWRLAPLVDEALLTLVYDLFTKPIYDVAELQKLLSQYPDDWGLLYKWFHWALYNPIVQDREKEIVWHRWAWEHPQREHPKAFDKVPSPERYLEIMAEKERKRIEEQLRLEREAEEEKLQIERETEARRIELERIAKSRLNEEEIQLILAVKEPDALLALASNTVVPIESIQKLINCHHVKGARQIREAAEKNIQARS